MSRRARVVAVAVVAACWLAVIGGIALAKIDKQQQGTGVAIVVPAAAVLFGALVWLGRRKQ